MAGRESSGRVADEGVVLTLASQHTACRACLEGQPESGATSPQGCSIPRRLPDGVNSVPQDQCSLAYPTTMCDRRTEMEPRAAEIRDQTRRLNAAPTAPPAAMATRVSAPPRPARRSAPGAKSGPPPSAPNRHYRRAPPAPPLVQRRQRTSEFLRAGRDFGVALSAFVVFPLLPLLLALLMRAYYFAPGLEAVKPPPLHHAAATNHARLVREMLEAGVRPDAGKCLDAFGTSALGQLSTKLPYVALGCAASETPLYAAAAAGQFLAVEALLRGGASVHRGQRRLFDVRTPILAAAEAGEGEVAGLLLQHGARLSSCREARLCYDASARKRSAIYKGVVRRLRLRPLARVGWHVARAVADFLWGGALAVLFGPFSFLWLVWRPPREGHDEEELYKMFGGF